jgi:ATP-dependent Clp protease protease subunit
MGIYDTMQFIQPDIVTICAGGSYGMATLLLAAGTRGKRFALPNATINLHSAKSDITGYAPDIKVDEQQSGKIEARINQIIAFHTGQPVEKIQTDFQIDRYLSSEEALNYGFIDEIITRNPTLES